MLPETPLTDQAELNAESDLARLRLAHVLVHGIYDGFPEGFSDEARAASEAVIGHLLREESRIRPQDENRDLVASIIIHRFDLPGLTREYANFTANTSPETYFELRDDFLVSHKKLWAQLEEIYNTDTTHSAFNTALHAATRYTEFVEAVIHAVSYGHQAQEHPLFPHASPLEIRHGVAGDIFNLIEGEYSVLDALIFLPREIVGYIGDPQYQEGRHIRDHITAYVSQQLALLEDQHTPDFFKYRQCPQSS